jgi:hypothetical protein
MNWEKSDFKKLRVDVVSMASDRNCLKENEWLALVFNQFIDDAELNSLKGVTINLMVRVICVVYDYNSPLVLRIQDIKQRKIEAFRLFETKTYKDRDGRFSQDVEDIIVGKNVKFNRMVLQFLKAIDSLSYVSMSYFTESYYDLLSQLQTQDPKEKAQTMVLIDRIEAQAKRKAKEFFMGDEKLIDYVASEGIYEESKKLSPEVMANKFKLMKESE